MDETLPHHDEIVEIDGRRYHKVDTGYTIREYYSHTSEKGPGPGWDSRMKLLKQGYTQEQVFDSSKLPDEPMYRLKEAD